MKTVKPYTCPGECRGHFQQLLEKVIPSGCVCVCVCVWAGRRDDTHVSFYA